MVLSRRSLEILTMTSCLSMLVACADRQGGFEAVKGNRLGIAGKVDPKAGPAAGANQNGNSLLTQENATDKGAREEAQGRNSTEGSTDTTQDKRAEVTVREGQTSTNAGASGAAASGTSAADTAASATNTAATGATAGSAGDAAGGAASAATSSAYIENQGLISMLTSLAEPGAVANRVLGLTVTGKQKSEDKVELEVLGVFKSGADEKAIKTDFIAKSVTGQELTTLVELHVDEKRGRVIELEVQAVNRAENSAEALAKSGLGALKIFASCTNKCQTIFIFALVDETASGKARASGLVRYSLAGIKSSGEIELREEGSTWGCRFQSFVDAQAGKQGTCDAEVTTAQADQTQTAGAETRTANTAANATASAGASGTVGVSGADTSGAQVREIEAQEKAEAAQRTNAEGKVADESTAPVTSDHDAGGGVAGAESEEVAASRGASAGAGGRGSEDTKAELAEDNSFIGRSKRVIEGAASGLQEWMKKREEEKREEEASAKAESDRENQSLKNRFPAPQN